MKRTNRALSITRMDWQQQQQQVVRVARKQS